MNHRQSHIIILLLLLLSLCHAAVAVDSGRFAFRKFNAIDKLPIDEVRCMHQDRLGFVWIGTKNGLCCMDMRTGLTKTYHFTDFDIGKYVYL